MPEPDENPTGALLDGRYQLGECLGRGGMADVFRAVDILLGREVAVKMIRPGVDGVAAPERARGEVSVLAALNHPSLVTLLDAQLERADQEYLVMELVEGPTLGQRVRESPLPPHEAAQLASEIAEALHVVHSGGIVHRDIKPSNVLLSPSHMPGRQFRAKLADFGIAYLVDTTRVTTPGDVIGTAAYLAPEQVHGAPPAPATDVYALGLVLLEALTGQPAFPHAGGIASALARLNAPPEIPAELGPEWTDLLERMTRIEPSERPTALEVAVETSRLATSSHHSALLAAAAATAPIAAAAAAAPIGAAAEPATRVFAPLADDATAVHDAVPSDTDDAAAEAGKTSRRRRRGMLVGAAAVGVAAVVAAGLWGAGVLAGTPAPASTNPAVTVPSVAPTGATSPTLSPTPVIAGNVETSEEDEARQQEEQRAQQEQEAQRLAEEEARKQAEEAARQAEEAQRQAEEEAQSPAQPAETAPPAEPAPAPTIAPLPTPGSGGG